MDHWNESPGQLVDHGRQTANTLCHSDGLLTDGPVMAAALAYSSLLCLELYFFSAL